MKLTTDKKKKTENKKDKSNEKKSQAESVKIQVKENDVNDGVPEVTHYEEQ